MLVHLLLQEAGILSLGLPTFKIDAVMWRGFCCRYNIFFVLQLNTQYFLHVLLTSLAGYHYIWKYYIVMKNLGNNLKLALVYQNISSSGPIIIEQPARVKFENFFILFFIRITRFLKKYTLRTKKQLFKSDNTSSTTFVTSDCC